MNLISFISFGCGILFLGVSGKPAGNEINTGISQEVVWFLADKGYYKVPDSKVGVLANEKTIQKSLSDLQAFAGLNITGKFDDATKKLVQTPRCGLPDVSGSMETRKRRYTLQGTKWRKSTLTWKLLNDNNDGLTRKQVEDTLTTAFSRWQAITNLKFIKLELDSRELVDIEVKFVTYYHSDPYPFDGPGGTLAHAFYPHTNEGLSGDVHFDDDEQFTLGSPNGKNLLWVAVHEIGHSIGLEHSNVRESIMFPWYKGYQGDEVPLTYDDIVGIQALYGSKSVKPTPSKTPEEETTKSTAKPETCDFNMETVLYDEYTKETYVINGNKVYIIDEHLKYTEGPFELTKKFPGIENIDTAYINEDKQVVFFKGNMYYIYTNMKTRKFLNSGRIFDKFRGLRSDVTKIDAAFVWPGNGRTYLFSGRDYYRYNGLAGTIDYSYPKDIEQNWDGIPSNVEAVFTWKNGVSYFFKNHQYYRIDSRAKLVAGYPRRNGGVWSQCKSSLKERNSSGSAVQSSMGAMLFSTLAVLFAKFF